MHCSDSKQLSPDAVSLMRREGDIASDMEGQHGKDSIAWWDHADIVFCSSICFSDSLMQVRRLRCFVLAVVG